MRPGKKIAGPVILVAVIAVLAGVAVVILRKKSENR